MNTPGACKIGGQPKENFFEKNSKIFESIFIGFLVEFGDTLVPILAILGRYLIFFNEKKHL